MLRQNPISIVQLGEMLIAVVYALLAREQSAHMSQEFGRPSLRQMLTRSSSTSIEQRPSS
jgi:hypothetical protein